MGLVYTCFLCEKSRISSRPCSSFLAQARVLDKRLNSVAIPEIFFIAVPGIRCRTLQSDIGNDFYHSSSNLPELGQTFPIRHVSRNISHPFGYRLLLLISLTF